MHTVKKSVKMLVLLLIPCIICNKAVESRKMKVSKALLFFCEAYFQPFPPQSNSRAFLFYESEGFDIEYAGEIVVMAMSI